MWATYGGENAPVFPRQVAEGARVEFHPKIGKERGGKVVVVVVGISPMEILPSK